MLTTAVRARRATNPNSAINAGYHYAGVMIRNPASNTGPQNFVFVGTGKHRTKLNYLRLFSTILQVMKEAVRWKRKQQ